MGWKGKEEEDRKKVKRGEKINEGGNERKERRGKKRWRGWKGRRGRK